MRTRGLPVSKVERIWKYRVQNYLLLYSVDEIKMQTSEFSITLQLDDITTVKRRDCVELWDVYDINRTKTNRTWVRGKKLQPSDFFLVIHVCIFNSNGEMLIQQRQSFKEGWPNMWDLTVGGSAIAGDTSQMAAQRELLEELGLQIDFQCIRPHLTINFEYGFDDIYLIEKDVDLHTLTLQHEEKSNSVLNGSRFSVTLQYYI